MTNTGILSRVMDALDIETFLVSSSEEEGRELALRLMKSLGFQDVDMVFAQYSGSGTRVRVRAYIYRPGTNLGWLTGAAAPGDRTAHPIPTNLALGKIDMEVGTFYSTPEYLRPEHGPVSPDVPSRKSVLNARYNEFQAGGKKNDNLARKIMARLKSGVKT